MTKSTSFRARVGRFGLAAFLTLGATILFTTPRLFADETELATKDEAVTSVATSEEMKPGSNVSPPLDSRKGEPALITVHYHRYDGDYEGAGLWTWDADHGRQPEEAEVMPSGEDDYGIYFTVDPALYGPENEPGDIGFIVRLKGSWDHKDGGDRFWNVDMGEEIWLVGNDADIHAERPDIAPKVQFAFIDGLDKITVRLSHGIELSRLLPENFQVRSAMGDLYAVKSVRAYDARGGKTRLLEVKLEEHLNYKHDIAVLVDGYRAGTATLRELLFDKSRFYSDEPMGAHYAASGTTFRVFSPTADGVKVVLYDNPTGPEGRREVSLKGKDNGVWEATVSGDLEGQHYMLWVDADGPLTRREVYDPYAICTTGHDGRGKIVDLDKTDPEGFDPTSRPANIERATDAVIWEIHTRDYSISPNSGFPDEHKGKYTAFTIGGTTVPGTDIKTGVDHLKALGITHIQILPIQDFDNREFDNEYNWGYMTSQFNSPDGWYASDVRDSSRITEFKQLVQAMHDAGIRVIMDVVYNHTAPNATFESVVPGYYHRTRDDGSFWNGSGTGNEFRSEAPMARKFIVDSCVFWVKEYGVDGFRFDLMGLVDLETMKEIRRELDKIDPTILLFGEPWAATGPDGTGIKQITYKDVSAGSNVGAFNDNFRNALKGSPEGEDGGFVQDGSNTGGVKAGIHGAIHDWASQPADAIQYGTCHDNLTLWDKSTRVNGEYSDKEKVEMNALTAGILAVSQGAMFLNAGHEFGRTKYGEHNSYNKPDSVNMLKWERLQQFPELNEYVQGAIAVRRAHPVFRLSSREEVDRRVVFHEDRTIGDKTIVFSLDGTELEGESWDTTLVIINGDRKAHNFALPKGDWDVYIEGMSAGLSVISTEVEKLDVSPRSMTLLVRRQPGPPNAK